MADSIFTENFDTSKLMLVAINVLLQLINEPPIESEEDILQVIEAQIALDTLREARKEVLADGWDFNTDNGYNFPPDLDGYIAIPSNVLDLSSTDGDLIMRDWRLYSKSSQSAIFTEAQSIDVIWDMDFNSLTHPIRNYITIRAGLKFQARQVGDVNIHRLTQSDMEDAFVMARRSETRTGKYNMLTGSYGQNANARL